MATYKSDKATHLSNKGIAVHADLKRLKAGVLDAIAVVRRGDSDAALA
ncbi:hypothetical protein [Sorangium cellulosum]|nr:hypothetical protein [Sorangium cellulosum]